jgi:hypothetical protein
MDFTTISSTFSINDAQLICSRLEAAGFHPFLANENTASWMAGFSPLANVLVQVPTTEAADAKEFLETPMTPAE